MAGEEHDLKGPGFSGPGVVLMSGIGMEAMGSCKGTVELPGVTAMEMVPLETSGLRREGEFGL